MKKIILLSMFFGLIFVGSAMAFLGSHNFLSMQTYTSDGHRYVSAYQTRGGFPFNGLGLYDKSRVDLKGVFMVSQEDGVAVMRQYCVNLQGSLKTTGGSLTAKVYNDPACSQLIDKKLFTVSSYSETATGSFNLVAKDDAGIVYTTNGTHQLIK